MKIPEKIELKIQTFTDDNDPAIEDFNELAEKYNELIDYLDYLNSKEKGLKK